MARDSLDPQVDPARLGQLAPPPPLTIQPTSFPAIPALVALADLVVMVDREVNPSQLQADLVEKEELVGKVALAILVDREDLVELEALAAGVVKTPKAASIPAAIPEDLVALALQVQTFPS